MALRLLVNIDVPDVAAALDFYGRALGLTAARRLEGGIVELAGLAVPVYLLPKAAGTATGADTRRYSRHWSPVHLDIVVDDHAAASDRAVAAGATVESGPVETPFGTIATFADPFGHGFCLIAFSREGYDAIRED